MVLTASLPREAIQACVNLPFLCLPLLGTRPNVISSLPIKLHVLCALVVEESASIQFIFRENHSTYRYIFDVFVEGSKLRILLLWHLDLLLFNSND